MRGPLVISAVLSAGCASPAPPPRAVNVPPPFASPAPTDTTPPAPPPKPAARPAPARPLACPTRAFYTNGRAYCGYLQPETWAKAEATCVTAGGRLMAPATQTQTDELHRALGSRSGADGRAAWVGIAAAGDPKLCVEVLFVNGHWNETSCELRQPYICQAGRSRTACRDATLVVSSGTRSGAFYCLFAKDATYAEARAACNQGDGSSLATPRSNEDKNSLIEELVRRFPVERMWRGSAKADACSALSADRWTSSELDCGEKLPYVCEGAAAPGVYEP